MELSKTEIYIKIMNMESILFEGNVTSLTSENDLGVFDVLPLHTNFITMIKNKIIAHKPGGDQTFEIQNGVLKASENKVFIFLDV